MTISRARLLGCGLSFGHFRIHYRARAPAAVYFQTATRCCLRRNALPGAYLFDLPDGRPAPCCWGFELCRGAFVRCCGPDERCCERDYRCLRQQNQPHESFDYRPARLIFDFRLFFASRSFFDFRLIFGFCLVFEFFGPGCCVWPLGFLGIEPTQGWGQFVGLCPFVPLCPFAPLCSLAPPYPLSLAPPRQWPHQARAACIIGPTRPPNAKYLGWRLTHFGACALRLGQCSGG